MSATQTVTVTSSRNEARCYTVVANEIYNLLLEVVKAYGLALGILTSRLDVIMSGLRVWTASKQLESVVLELLDRKGTLVRKFEIPLNFGKTDQDEETYESEMDQLREFLAHDQAKVHKFRLIVCTNTDDFIQVPGWKLGELKPDGHLQSQQLTDKLVCTKFARAGVYVYTDNPQVTKGGT